MFSSVLISYVHAPDGVLATTTISPSLRYVTRRVRSMTAEASEASRYSSSPMPSSSGEPFRAPTRRSGSSEEMTQMPYAPCTCERACRTASSSGIHFCFLTSEIRCAISSVSVSDAMR